MRLAHVCTIVHKKEKRNVYSNKMKLRVLVQNINVGFIHCVKVAMSIELTRVTLFTTYEQRHMAVRNEINRKHPPEVSKS